MVLQEKIRSYEDRIVELKEYILQQDDSDVFGRIRIVEAQGEIRDYESRIENLRKRLRGEKLCNVTDEQIALADWVNSPVYDNE